MSCEAATVELQCDGTCVAGARRAVERFAAGSALADRIDDLRLLVSEVVTNSVRHAARDSAQPIVLRLHRCERSLRVEVVDGGKPWTPKPRTRPVDEPGGWGLVLLERMTSRWGVDCQDGTCVWFELGADMDIDTTLTAHLAA